MMMMLLLIVVFGRRFDRQLGFEQGCSGLLCSSSV